MRIVTFSDIYTMEVRLTDLFGMRQTWTDGVLFRRDTPRTVTGMIYLNGCTGEYTAWDGTRFFAPMKSVVCLPAGSRYTVRNLTGGGATPDAYLAECNLWDGEELLSFGDRPFLVETGDPVLVPSLIRDAVEAYESPISSPLSVQGAVCTLLGHLGKSRSDVFRQRFSAILPGIDILENDPLSSLSLEEIAARCGVSSGCFRKLFRQYAGKSPVQYRTGRRIEVCKAILERSDIPIEEAGTLLGFENPAYLFRLFRKETGMTPGQYRKQFRR